MFNFYSRIIFIISFTTGIVLTIVLFKISSPQINSSFQKSTLSQHLYNRWFINQKLKRKPLDWDQIRYSNKTVKLESAYLFSKIQVLCIILIRKPSNAEAAQDTWAKGCNKLEFVHLSQRAKKIVPLSKSRLKSSWVSLCESLKNIKERFDWVLIVNDDTFALIENLRMLVAGLDKNKPYYLGHPVKFWGTVYNWSQAGYALSHGALEALKFIISEKEYCTKDLTYWNKEDYYLGKTLAKLNITPIKTTDDEGLDTFHPYNFYHLFFPGENYYQLSVYPPKCCSPFSITFQAIEGDKMYTYYYLLYTMQIFKQGGKGNNPLPAFDKSEVWKKFLKERNIPIDNITSDAYYKAWEDLIQDPTSFAYNMKKELHIETS